MFIIRNRKFFVGLSFALMILSFVSLAVYGFKPGIEFKGGALTEVYYVDGRPDVSTLETSIGQTAIKDAHIQPTGTDGYIVKTRDITEKERQDLFNALSLDGKIKADEKSFTTIGPSVGKELARKAVVAVVAVILVIMTFIAYAFRHVSEPVSSWKYGMITMVALLHDVAIPAGLFALITHFKGVEVDTLFVVALLTILGLSISDTIVVFDRIRENLKNNYDRRTNETFEYTVGQSISQTFTRSINTSLTVILVLIALLIWGPETTRYFALTMTAGMFFGTYSSIFLASPLLVMIQEWQDRKKNK